jgi:hypothetical protein
MSTRISNKGLATQALGRDSKADISAMLRQMGYSEKAVQEILKWYENSDFQAERRGERGLCSGNIRQQKPKR